MEKNSKNKTTSIPHIDSPSIKKNKKKKKENDKEINPSIELKETQTSENKRKREKEIEESPRKKERSNKEEKTAHQNSIQKVDTEIDSPKKRKKEKREMETVEEDIIDENWWSSDERIMMLGAMKKQIPMTSRISRVGYQHQLNKTNWDDVLSVVNSGTEDKSRTKEQCQNQFRIILKKLRTQKSLNQILEEALSYASDPGALRREVPTGIHRFTKDYMSKHKGDKDCTLFVAQKEWRNLLDEEKRKWTEEYTNELRQKGLLYAKSKSKKLEGPEKCKLPSELYQEARASKGKELSPAATKSKYASLSLKKRIPFIIESIKHQKFYEAEAAKYIEKNPTWKKTKAHGLTNKEIKEFLESLGLPEAPPSHVVEMYYMEEKDNITEKNLNDSVKDKSDKKKSIKKQKTYDKAEIMKAFERGFTREVVYRSAQNELADIYYFTPNNTKKLRSLKDIEKYLEQQKLIDLSVSNFTFIKTSLDVGEQYEIIRLSNPNKGNKSEDVNEDVGDLLAKTIKPYQQAREAFNDLPKEQQNKYRSEWKKSWNEYISEVEKWRPNVEEKYPEILEQALASLAEEYPKNITEQPKKETSRKKAVDPLSHIERRISSMTKLKFTDEPPLPARTAYDLFQQKFKQGPGANCNAAQTKECWGKLSEDKKTVYNDRFNMLKQRSKDSFLSFAKNMEREQGKIYVGVRRTKLTRYFQEDIFAEDYPGADYPILMVSPKKKITAQVKDETIKEDASEEENNEDKEEVKEVRESSSSGSGSESSDSEVEASQPTMVSPFSLSFGKNNSRSSGKLPTKEDSSDSGADLNDESDSDDEKESSARRKSKSNQGAASEKEESSDESSDGDYEKSF